MNKQCQRVVDYMREHGSISQYEAIRDISVMRLASRISDIKNQGVKVNKIMVKDKNKYNEPIVYARYSLGG